jgi:DNA-directed RNA polymerase subunit RPC12/RpoP
MYKGGINMRCPKCGREMKNVMHFESGKDYQYNRCKHCLERTKQKRIHYEDFEKGNKQNERD